VTIVGTRLEACSYEACSYEACSYEACSYEACSYEACSYKACSYEACSYKACSHNNDKEYQYPTGIGPLIKNSVSSFINHLKGKIKRWCNENRYSEFHWQARFHDRIIRNAHENDLISKYIQNNVANWESDDEKL